MPVPPVISIERLSIRFLSRTRRGIPHQVSTAEPEDQAGLTTQVRKLYHRGGDFVTTRPSEIRGDFLDTPIGRFVVTGPDAIQAPCNSHKVYQNHHAKSIFAKGDSQTPPDRCSPWPEDTRDSPAPRISMLQSLSVIGRDSARSAHVYPGLWRPRDGGSCSRNRS